MMARQRFTWDSAILVTVTLLLVFGTVMVYSASSFKAVEDTGDSHYYLKNHFYKVLAAFVVMLVVARFKYQFFLRLSPWLLGICFIALIFLLVSPTVEAIRGSRRWIVLGPVNVQPSDFARIALILFLSHSLGKVEFNGPDWGGERLLKLLGIIGAIVLPIMLQPDIGTAALTTVIAITLIFLAGEKLRYLALLGLTAIPLFLLFLKHNEYQRGRILQYVSSIKGEQVSWQVKQSLIALGDGSFTGLGLGSGRQKYDFLPDPFTDFIYAIIGEELGILGALAILGLFLIIIWRGHRIALMAPDPKGRILAIGITLNIGIYALANVGVVTNLLPTTGIPLPFISYGGSALMANLFVVGILLNISSQIKQNRRLYPADNVYQRQTSPKRHGKRRR